MNKSTSALDQSIYFTCALILVFLRFSLLHETIASLTGRNNYLLYIFAPVALFGVIASNGLQRVFRAWPAKFWAGFLICMVLAIPFSSWIGGSATQVLVYIRTNFIMLLVTAGLATRWVHCKAILYAIALAAIVNLGSASLLVKSSSSDRLALQGSGTINNSNDLAAHMLLVLPFLLFIVLKPRVHIVFRLLSLAAILLGVSQILRTGSRGAFIALGVSLLFILVRGPRRLKIALGTTLPILLAILILVVPSSTRQRLTSFTTGDKATEASASSEFRQYLLEQSLIYTFQHPIFGVGPGQFMIYENQIRKNEGLRGSWHGTHNSYTQISSECGIPAFFFYLAAVISTFLLLGRIRRRAKASGREEILAATFCITLGLVSYSIATLFVNFGYSFYFPAISGLVVGMWYAVCHDPHVRLVNSDVRQNVMAWSEVGTLGVSDPLTGLRTPE
jgi:O-antigen ligase